MKWSYRAETVKNGKRLKPEFDIHLWPIDPKIDRGPSQVKANTSVKYHYCLPKGKWSCVGETVERFKVQNLTFDLLIQNQQRSSVGQGQHICEISSLYVKWKGSYGTWTTFHRRTDRWTDRDSHGETSIPSQLRWRGYINLFSMWRNRWKMTPWRS